MVGHHETTHGTCQDPIPICVIEYGWCRYALIIWYMVGHHENNIWPKPRPNTNMHDWVWRWALIKWQMVGHHENLWMIRLWKWKWKKKKTKHCCSTMSRISHHGEYLNATPLGNWWLQDARHEAILEKEDEKVQEHPQGGKSRARTAGWSKKCDDDGDKTCGTSAHLCPSSPLDVHPLQPRGRELLHSISRLHTTHSFINVMPWGLGFGQGKNMSKHKYMAEGLSNLPCLALLYWISEFQDGAFSLADWTFLVLDDFLVMIMIMTSHIQSFLFI